MIAHEVIARAADVGVVHVLGLNRLVVLGSGAGRGVNAVDGGLNLGIHLGVKSANDLARAPGEPGMVAACSAGRGAVEDV